jgi:heme exporter protein A
MLAADNLACERGGRTLFQKLSFALHAGEALRIAGPNGSGKTSLLRILCGLLSPTEGMVSWTGIDVARLREEYSKKLVYLGHAQAVKDELSAEENLAISCRLAGQQTSKTSLHAALDRFGLSGNSFPVKRLSQGQRRRAALARLVLSESRPLWLLDEPFSALDAEGVSILNTLIKDHLARGGALAFTTHLDFDTPSARVVSLGGAL